MRFVAIFQALLTPVIAIVTAYIAWQQWKGNQLKLKMERYERRLHIYQEVVKTLQICTNGKPEWAELIEFGAATAEADFLFGPEIRKYLDEIVSRGAKLRAAHAEYRDYTQPVPEGYDHNKVVKDMTEQQNWFADQLIGSHAKNKFASYLNIS